MMSLNQHCCYPIKGKYILVLQVGIEKADICRADIESGEIEV